MFLVVSGPGAPKKGKAHKKQEKLKSIKKKPPGGPKEPENAPGLLICPITVYAGALEHTHYNTFGAESSRAETACQRIGNTLTH